MTEAQIGTSTWQAAVDHGFFILLDVAIGGGFPNGVCNCSTPVAATSSGAAMSVGYVAVYTNSRRRRRRGRRRRRWRQVVHDHGDVGHLRRLLQRQPGHDQQHHHHGHRPGRGGLNQVAQLTNGEYLKYSGVNFGSGSTQFDARVASGAAGGVSGLVEVVLDNPANAPVGSFAVANTGGWSTWKTVPANISSVTGTHDVYLEFSSGAGGNPPFVSLHWFSFPAH